MGRLGSEGDGRFGNGWWVGAGVARKLVDEAERDTPGAMGTAASEVEPADGRWLAFMLVTGVGGSGKGETGRDTPRGTYDGEATAGFAAFAMPDIVE